MRSMVRRVITFLVVMFVTAALSSWWLYEGNVRSVAPVEASP
ncbi:MAG: hypothetical protein AAGA48_30420 [Myxococcota bacterium]